MSVKVDFKDLKSISGWFSKHDFLVMRTILELQNQLEYRGDILEIGSYHGKSSVLLGSCLMSDEKIILCDIFENANEEKNKIENNHSYIDLHSDFLVSNLAKFGINNYELVIKNSSILNLSDFPQNIRFIHIDGSHLYEYVKHDLNLACEIISKDYGVIALDDFRSQHTIGVQIAIWQEVLERKRTRPLIITPCKMYLVDEDFKLNLRDLQNELRKQQIETEQIILEDFQFLRTIGLSDRDVFRNGLQKSDFVPPIAAGILLRLRDLARRRFRSSRRP